MKNHYFNTLFDESDEGILILDQEHNIHYFNPAVYRIIPNLPKSPKKKDFEITIDFNIDLNVEISFDLFEIDYFILITKQQFHLNKESYFIYRLKSKDKDPIEQKLSFFLGNIDEIVYTERINQKQENRLGYISKGVHSITGCSAEDMMIKNIRPHHFAVIDDQKKIDRILDKINKSGRTDRCQFRIKNALNESTKWVELSIYPQLTEQGEHFANFAILRDISKHIEADQLLRQSELKHRLLFSEANDAIMIFKGHEMVDCNEKTLTMFDSPNFTQIAGKKLYELMPEKQPNGEDSILNYHYKMQKAIDGESQFFYWKHSKTNGTQFDSEVSINSFNVENEVFVQVIVRDITQRKIAEEQKNQSIKSYFEIFNSSSDLIFIVSGQGEVIDVNQPVLDTYEMLKTEIVGTPFEQLGELQIMSDDDLIKMGKAWTGEAQKFEWHCTTKKGKVIPLEMILHPGTYFGKEVIIASGRDISERLHNEKIMRQSETRFRTLAAHAPIGIFLTDNQGKAIYVNEKLKEIAYFPSVDGFMENWLSKVHPDDRARVKRYADITEKDNHQQYEYRLIPKKGDQRYVKAQVNLLKDRKGNVLGRVGTIEDFTREFEAAKLGKEAEKEKLRAEFAEETTRKLQQEIDVRIAAEKELKSAKEFNQYIIGSSIDMIIATDINGNITEFNKAASEGFGYESTKIVGTYVDPLFAEERDKETILKKVFQERKWSGEVLCKRANKTTFTGYLSASVLVDGEKEIIGTMGVLRDITELKKAEVELKNNVQQKEILLKEVHHRVKNNLQVISSILNLQTGYIDDEHTLEIIRECQDRIKSMAFIHESLYQKEDLAEVNLSEYLQNLCNNLKHSYRTPDRNILIDFDIDEISLSLDAAIPCGLIVNELVSNCFKYAFNDQNTGSIKVSLAKDNNNNKLLVVHDSGQGLPQDLNIETNDSLGLQLVWTLVDQIDGAIQYEYDKGSRFVINFKRD
ncbi:MAG: hypothetical protein CMP61_12080 [Flavobacteriales bacterium]|nr:hypothetical protein [Flavobacteriales bacterium]|tara:strand:+ start:16620 stop:19538 length:2919 start_codon:yes stop_codon:yes gene_type:complete